MIGLLVAAAQVSVILLVAFGLLWLLRKRTAGLRHAVILIAMACAAAVPVFSLYVPSWPVVSVVIPPFVEESTALAPPADPPSAHRIMSPSDASVRNSGSAIAAASATATADVRNWRTAVPRALDVAYTIYMTGLAISVVMLSIGLLQLHILAARATPMRNLRWQRRSAAIAAAYGLRRRVHLAQTSRPVLAAWGIVRPQVLLPAGAADWPDDRIRTVLLHELAHVRRNDWIVQVLANTFRAIYWFNPLVWIACSRLRQECEQACDDAAVQQGEDGVEYAGHLLTLARTLNHPAPLQLRAAASMARPSTLKRRVSVLVDPAIPHAPASRGSVAGIAVILLAVTGVVAACDGMRSTAPANAAQTPVNSPDTIGLPVQVAATPGPESATYANPMPVADEDAEWNVTPAVEIAAPGISGASASGTGRETGPRSPRIIVADILDLIQSALADNSVAALDEVQRPITGLHHVQRSATAILAEEAGNPATLAANYVEVINALQNTATFASNVTSTPRGSQLPKQRIDQLAAAMRNLADELAAGTMPIPSVTSVNVSTAERRAAIAALDLAQTTLRNVALVGPRTNSWLGNELDTLERAAQSVLNDAGADQGTFTMKLQLLRGALLSISRNADNIARRPRVNPDVLDNATELATSARRLANQLVAAMPRSWPPVLSGSHVQ